MLTERTIPTNTRIFLRLLATREYFVFAVSGGFFGGDCFKDAIVSAGSGDGHGDVHGGSIAGIDPWVIWNCVGEVEQLFRVGKEWFDDAAVNRLVN